MSEIRTKEMLKQMQSLPIEMKVSLTKSRIREWVRTFGENGVYVSFSGGKDSTVLLHIAREMYPDIKAVFVDTGLEYPEIRQFVKTFDNVEIIRTKKTFKQVISEYGYPVLSKEISERVYNAKKCIESGYEKYIEHYYQLTGVFPTISSREKYGDCFVNRYSYNKYKPLLYVDFNVSSMCCNVMKKNPLKAKTKYNITAQMAEESQLRMRKWLQNGCNAFECKNPISNPMSFWTEQDVLLYIKENNLPIASVYGDIVYEDADGQTRVEGCGKLCTTGCKRTGCVFCGFGAHLEKGEGRFVRLKRTHPKLYDYCINGGAYDDNGVWKPNEKGLGMGHVFDELNYIYEKELKSGEIKPFIKYK